MYIFKCIYNQFVLANQNNKIRMFTQGIFSIRDQLSLQNAEYYLRDLQNLVYFVNHVPIKGTIRQFNEHGFDKVKMAFEKAAEAHGVKVIPAIKTLLQRVQKEHLGFIELHTFFLQLCNRFFLPKQAVDILKYPGLFRNIPKKSIVQFLIAGCDIFIKLEEYNKAYELIQKGKRFDLLDNTTSLKLCGRIIVLQIYKGFQPQQEIKERLKFVILKAQNLGRYHYQNQNLNLLKEAQFYISLKAYRKLEEQQKVILKSHGLLDLYENCQWVSLRQYITNDIRKNNWRIKTDSIKQVKLSNLEAITALNKNQEIYKYDCKNGIMYFNHRQSDQEKLNNLITLSMSMSEEVSHSKSFRKEKDVEAKGLRMGSFGGMGGMGGFGEMGEYDGMRGRGMEFGRRFS